MELLAIIETNSRGCEIAVTLALDRIVPPRYLRHG